MSKPPNSPPEILSFFAAGLGEDAYVQFDAILSSIPAKIVLFGFTISILYHLINGVRHLVWDTGRGFDLTTATQMAWGVIIGSVALAIFTVVVI